MCSTCTFPFPLDVPPVTGAHDEGRRGRKCGTFTSDLFHTDPEPSPKTPLKQCLFIYTGVRARPSGHCQPPKRCHLTSSEPFRPSGTAAGARLHHSVATWPGLLDDETAAVAADPGRSLRLEAKARPIGRAVVEITLEPQGEGTLIRIREDAVSGPARLAPQAVRQAGITMRNRETLRRLALLAERRTRP